MKTVEFYNEYHLGDNVFHLTFLRKLCRLVDDNFVYYVNSAYLPELNKHLLGYLDRIELRSLEHRTPTAHNAWVGEIYYNHPNNFLYDAFYIDWFNYLTQKLYGKNFDIDMISDYIPCSYQVEGHDILFINSVPQSGQFEKKTELLDSVIQKLNTRYNVITTKRVAGVRCTLDYSMSLVDIGCVAANSKHIIAIETGPHSTCINKWALENVQSWIVGHNTNSFSFNKFSYARTMQELINKIKSTFLKGCSMTKLNLGCGYNHIAGYINVDHDTNCAPDIVADLDHRLPFADNSVTEIRLYHVLEHLGAATNTYFDIWKEFYRVLEDGGVVNITVPHWQHENFSHDPTHVRVVTPMGVNMFNQKRNQEIIESKGQETTLGIQLGIDFSVDDVRYDLDFAFQQDLISQGRTEVTPYDVSKYNNTCHQIYIKAVAHKPARVQVT